LSLKVLINLYLIDHFNESEINMRLIIILSLSLLIFSQCSSNYDDLANSLYTVDKLVVYGSVDNENGCVVKLSHSLKPIGKVADSLEIAITNARIVLLENGDSIRTITQGKLSYEGYEYSDSTVKPKVGAKYKIKVFAIGFTAIESEEEFFLQKPDIRDTSIVLGPGGLFGNQFYVFKGKLFFDSTQTHYFAITSFNRNDTCAVNISSSNNLDIKYQTCDAIQSYYPDFIGSSKCFYSGEEFIWNLGFNHTTSYVTNCISTTTSLRVSAISKIYFDYLKSLNQPPSPQDLVFKEPNTAVNNIKNGFGYFYTKNTVIFTKKI